MHIQRTTLRLCLWACLVAICWADQLAPLAEPAQNPCSSKTTCSDCIRVDRCAWCFAAGFNGPRCFDPALEGGTAGCDEAYVFNPDNEQSIDQAYNKELSNSNCSRHKPAPAKQRLVASCTWCFATGFNGPRCFNPALEGGACDEAYIFNPDNEQSIDQAYNKELSKMRSRSSSSSGSHGDSGSSGADGSAGGAMPTAGSGDNLVQIKPQRVNMRLRQNQMHKLSFAYSRALDYPLGHIQGSSSDMLTETPDNVVNLVREQYNKITSAVEITDTSSDATQIDYYSSCLDKTNVIKTNKCDGLRVGDVVEFTAEITLKQCPRDPSKWKQTFVIHPGDISEGLTVELDMQCDCPCEHRGHHAYDDSPNVCSGHGISACGVCACQPGSFGKYCECVGGVTDQDLGCHLTNASSGAECSGRGSCICGVCECDMRSEPTEVISGPFCECDNFSCDRNMGLLCSGPAQGECVCGQCQCKPGYTGAACDCLLDTQSCIPPHQGWANAETHATRAHDEGLEP
ncbi:integrin beta-PS-like [Cydia splendana]|uniref:integrin beta-PS-like n=1 Tax=Cydia splendana TaxID=1100963 RepID=UPI00300C009B